MVEIAPLERDFLSPMEALVELDGIEDFRVEYGPRNLVLPSPSNRFPVVTSISLNVLTKFRGIFRGLVVIKIN